MISDTGFLNGKFQTLIEKRGFIYYYDQLDRTLLL